MRLRNNDGFTLLEIALVLAVVAILATMAVPSLRNLARKADTRSAVTAVAGLMSNARDAAVRTGTPTLVIVNRAGGGGTPGANCPAGYTPPAVTLVSDKDSSYSVTPGDDVSTVDVPALQDCKVMPLGVAGAGSAMLAGMPIPPTDSSPAAAANGGSNSGMGNGSSGSGGSNSGSGSGSSGSGSLASALSSGSTLSVDASGNPIVAFSAAGFAVDPATPMTPGSGAGAIYLTDGLSSVYAVAVPRLGRVQTRVYDAENQVWK